MTKSEKNTWKSIYDKSGKYYKLNVTDEEKLDEFDSELLTPIVLTYQLGHTTVSSFKKTIKNSMKQNPMTAAYASKIDDMSISEISDLINYNVKTFKAEDEDGNTKTYVDMNQVQSMTAASERVFEFLAEDEETLSVADPVKLDNVDGAVAFEHVHFGYDPEQIIINDFSADVKPGQKIAIVGPTGAGKTTMTDFTRQRQFLSQ